MISIMTEEKSNKIWRNKYGRIHNDHGPAAIWNSKWGDELWWCNNGEFHRLEGPAKVSPTGIKQWFINGVELEREDHPFNIFRNKYNLPEDYDYWPKDKKMLFKLTYGGSI